MKVRRAALLALGVVIGHAGLAQAGGLDIPTLYTARHAGMAGTAISSVDDPSAVFHNPAGLGATSGTMALGNLSLLVVNQQTSPDYPNQNIKSGYHVGPAPFIAGSVRVHDLVAVGLGAYPIGAVSGHFEYNNSFGNPTLNEQTTVAYEITPAVGVQPIKELRFGLGYRITLLQFERRLGPLVDPSTVDVDTFGTNFAGFRLGAQWQPTPHFSLGAVYRHQVHVSAKADHGRLIAQDLTNVEATLTVPAKLGFGGRVDFSPVSVALDYEWIRNSEFDRLAVTGTLPSQGSQLNVPFTFNWSDSSTVKLGAQYRIHAVALRAGYAWDGRYANRAYPSTFSSPPVDSHYLTLGAGYDAGNWQINIAWAQRLPLSAYIKEEEIASKADCPFCASSGSYASSLTAGFIDFSINFEDIGVRNPFKQDLRNPFEEEVKK